MEQAWDFFKSHKNICGIVVLILLCVTFFSLYVKEATAEEAYTCPKIENTTKGEEDNEIVVDIKGAVQNPGIYRVKEGFIIHDVIVLAGGLTENADTSNLNLSKKVSDEMIINVYTKEEIKDLGKLDAITEVNTSTNEISKETKKISLNSATEEELTTLSGIGSSKAKLIIQYRTNCGPFQSIEELMNIKGIGTSIYEKIKDYITL